MVWSWVIWISIMLTVLGGGYWYIGSRLIGTMGWSQSAKTAALVGLAAMFLAPFLSMFLLRFMEGIGVTWAWATYVGLGFLSLLFTALVFRDVLLLGGKAVEYLLAFFQSSDSQPADPTRRQFLVQSTNLAVIGVAGALTAYGVYQARRAPGIVNLTIPLKNLPQAFEGFRIVQFTDIHAGLTVRRDWIETVARQIADLKPDLIAFTGDLVDGSVPHLRDDVAPLGELQAPHGKYFVTGNHEYYSGVGPWVTEAQRLGYDVLMNEHRLVHRNGASIILAGVPDQTSKQFNASHIPDPHAAIEGAPPDTIKILLAHQPRTLREAESLGFDLMLCGHTHGGQFFPWNLVATLGQPYIAGLHKHFPSGSNGNGAAGQGREGMWVYVSKGTGYWGPPVRLGARSEITVLTLTREGEA
jgi:predicted MPP superfamily phosphohydrolase